MPPKADKKEKSLKGKEAEDVVLEYLRSVNRPYASTDVSANLKNRVTKAEAQKALTVLADRGDLTVKPYGKQTIFVFNQATLPVLDPGAMGLLDAELKAASEDLENKKKELKTLQTELATTESLPLTQDLSTEISRLHAENTTAETALAGIRGESADAPVLAPEDMDKINRDWTRWRKEWVARKKVYKEMIGMLSDGGAFTSPAAEFEEERGVEPDDAATVGVEAGEFCAARTAAGKGSAGNSGHVVPAKRRGGLAGAEVMAEEGGGGSKSGSGLSKRSRK